MKNLTIAVFPEPFLPRTRNASSCCIRSTALVLRKYLRTLSSSAATSPNDASLRRSMLTKKLPLQTSYSALGPSNFLLDGSENQRLTPSSFREPSSVLCPYATGIQRCHALQDYLPSRIALVHGSENHLFESLHHVCRAAPPAKTTVEPMGVPPGWCECLAPVPAGGSQRSSGRCGNWRHCQGTFGIQRARLRRKLGFPGLPSYEPRHRRHSLSHAALNNPNPQRSHPRPDPQPLARTG